MIKNGHLSAVFLPRKSGPASSICQVTVLIELAVLFSLPLLLTHKHHTRRGPLPLLEGGEITASYGDWLPDTSSGRGILAG